MTQHTADQRTMHAIAAALAAGYRMAEKAARQGAVPLECHHFGRALRIALDDVSFRPYRSCGVPFRNGG